MSERVIALSGGIGGAKLALGLYRTLDKNALTVVCNTGDDFEHLGLTICPDIDTVTYTLGGLASKSLGWGREGETWAFMQALEELGGETWFKLGDCDLATHVERTRRLVGGETLTTITRDFARALQIDAVILPMSDAAVRTVVQTPEGPLPFQRYFVEQQCAPQVTGFVFDGADAAQPTDGLAAQLADPNVRCIVICPSNPFISIDPILAVPGIRQALRQASAPKIAVSPLVGGTAVKGPTAKMMTELGLDVSNAAIARYYSDILDGMVIDIGEREDAARLDVRCLAVPTLMKTDQDKIALAEQVLTFADQLRG